MLNASSSLVRACWVRAQEHSVVEQKHNVQGSLCALLIEH